MVLPIAVESLKSQDPTVILAIDLLAQMGAEAGGAVPALQAVSKTRSPYLREKAAEAVEKIKAEIQK